MRLLPKLAPSDRLPSVARTAIVLVGVGTALLALSADWLISGARGLGPFQLLFLAGGVGFCLLAMLPASTALTLILLAGGTASGLLLAEVALRVFFTDRITSNIQLDSRYLYRLTPGSRKRVTRMRVNGGQNIVVRVNSSGFRGEELRPRGAGRRVVVYGDSFIEGDFSELDSTFARRLEHALASRLNEPVEVVNAGVRGYGPDQVALRMEDELPVLRPDLVIVAIYPGNDFGDLLRNQLFSLDSADNLVPHTVVVADSIAEQFKVAQPGGLALVRLIAKLSSPSPVETLPTDIVDRWLRAKRQQYRDATSPGEKVLRTPLGDPYDVDVSTAPSSAAARYQVGLMQAVLRRIREIAERNQAPLLVMIIPALTDLCDSCGAGVIDTVRFPDYRKHALTDLMQRLAEQEHVPYANLYTPAWAVQAPSLYFRGGDDHWNDRGQAVAAEAIARVIFDREMLGRVR